MLSGFLQIFRRKPPGKRYDSHWKWQKNPTMIIIILKIIFYSHKHFYTFKYLIWWAWYLMVILIWFANLPSPIRFPTVDSIVIFFKLLNNLRSVQRFFISEDIDELLSPMNSHSVTCSVGEFKFRSVEFWWDVAFDELSFDEVSGTGARDVANPPLETTLYLWANAH